ncbi:sigma-70 family RNA polymerase sigma factor [Paenibacillus thermotolerans]|uniref:sigma-70 family RNA polymerase sigma factor n=1 Tax=Paenibacillus thermotolerans TaxID=3027807 RepID=UPI0023678E0D|nr:MULTISPECIES: sigma-70 family RNA polymerase sigma factor [unclassified Paenibacillus]
MLEQLSDEQLTNQARLGDHDAFNVLLARHRDKAFGWAKKVTNDTHMAEDVVQEALIRAFMKMATLVDLNKFLPWLRTIVRNQAMMKLRRGGIYRKERPFSSYENRPGDEEPDYGNLDIVLHRLSEKLRQREIYEDDVTTDVLNADLPETMSVLVRSLGPKERQVFEKHFYEQLSPQEIADYFDTNVNNVHKMISRIRKKVEDEKIEIDLRSRIHIHMKEKGLRSVCLTKPGLLGDRPIHPGMSIPHCLFHLMPFAGKKLTMAEVMGFSGYAFLLNVSTQSINPGSIINWDWDTFLANGLKNLGLHSRYVDYQHYRHAPDSPHKTRKLLFTLDMIRESIDGGLPVYLNNGLHYEGALVYGYDDINQLLQVMDSRADRAIPYTHLYYGNSLVQSVTARELYAYACTKSAQEESEVLKLFRLLNRILNYAEGKDYTFLPLTNGLQAYDAWIGAFRRKSVDPLGNASCLMVYGWCREYAAQFWKEQAARWTDGTSFGAKLSGLMHEAELRYAAVADVFRALQTKFPFPRGGDPHQEGMADAAIELLRTAKSEEEAGVRIVSKMIDLLRSELELTKLPVHALPTHIPISPFYSFGGNRFEAEETEAAEYRLDSVIVLCSDLKRSIRFYSRLFGMNIIPDLEDGPIGVLPMSSGHNLVLMDERLDLTHTDWRPSAIIRSSNITVSFEEAKQQRWEIIYPLDRGGVHVHFFVASDPDGHQIIVTSGPLPYSSVCAATYGSPIELYIDRACFAVKDAGVSRENYSRLFPSSGVIDQLELINKFQLTTGDTRIGLRTKDIKKACKWMSEMGVPILFGPDQLGDGSVGIVIPDPDGNRIAIRVRY